MNKTELREKYMTCNYEEFNQMTDIEREMMMQMLEDEIGNALNVFDTTYEEYDEQDGESCKDYSYQKYQINIAYMFQIH